MLFVAAAGNNWRDIDFWPTYPANYNAPNVITVAATDSSDLRAWFSNYGAKSVHIAAPGDNILSTVRRREYAFFSGTSMATPHVAGAAALVLSNCSLNTFGLKDVLMRTADKLGSLSGVTSTGARLNVAKAVANCSMPYYTMAAKPAEMSVTTRRGSHIHSHHYAFQELFGRGDDERNGITSRSDRNVPARGCQHGRRCQNGQLDRDYAAHNSSRHPSVHDQRSQFDSGSNGECGTAYRRLYRRRFGNAARSCRKRRS